jgi:hypothetical protein
MVIVRIVGCEREDWLEVDHRSIKQGCIDIGYPVGTTETQVLVDLGRETIGGTHRMWVPRSEVFGWEALAMGQNEEAQLDLPL